MKIEVKAGNLAEFECDVLVVNLFAGVTKPGGATGAVDGALDGMISDWIGFEEFAGKEGEVLEIQPHGKIPAKKVFLAGLGEKSKFGFESIRRVSADIARRAKGAKTVATVLHGAGIGGLKAKDAAEALTFGTLLSAYHFGKYQSDEKKNKLEGVVIVERDKRKINDIKKGIERGEIVAQAVMNARDLVNEPSSELTPVKFAEHTKELLKGTGLDVKVLDKEEIKKIKMNAFLAVAKGSHEQPRFIHITYRPKTKTRKKIAVVGKGITFDTGGLSIKSSSSMTSMKNDMAGAAAMISAMWAVSRLKPQTEIHGITALTENMPGGGAYKPDDIVVAMNGKSIEIGDTDAEGRVTMADSLSYAVKLEPSEIVDLATLTGSMMAALGTDYAGVMGRRGLPEKVVKSANTAGERMWLLPLAEEYRELNKSQWADVKNISSSKYGGGITAGLFLSEFVDEKIPWAHVDIAGPAWSDAEKNYVSKEGTGFGVRTLIEYLTR